MNHTIKQVSENWSRTAYRNVYTVETRANDNLFSIFYEGFLWVRNYNPATLTADIYIGVELFGQVDFTGDQMNFNGEKISDWFYTSCTKATIHRNIRQAVIDYFNTFFMCSVEEANKILRSVVQSIKFARRNTEIYSRKDLLRLRAKAIRLNRIAHGTI